MQTKGDQPGVITKVLYYVFLITGAIISVFPFYWMFVIGSNGRGAATRIPPVVTIGDQFVEELPAGAVEDGVLDSDP